MNEKEHRRIYWLIDCLIDNWATILSVIGIVVATGLMVVTQTDSEANSLLEIAEGTLGILIIILLLVMNVIHQIKQLHHKKPSFGEIAVSRLIWPDDLLNAAQKITLVGRSSFRSVTTHYRYSATSWRGRCDLKN